MKEMDIMGSICKVKIFCASLQGKEMEVQKIESKNILTQNLCEVMCIHLKITEFTKRPQWISLVKKKPL